MSECRRSLFSAGFLIKVDLLVQRFAAAAASRVTNHALHWSQPSQPLISDSPDLITTKLSKYWWHYSPYCLKCYVFLYD